MRFKLIKQRGIMLRSFNIIVCVVAAIVTVLLVIMMERTQRLYSNTHEMSQRMVLLTNDAFQLQDASDYLTEQIRAFAVTGEKKYMDNYFEEACTTKRRDKALEELGKYKADSESYASLSAAMVKSLNLMNTEYYAAKLTIQGYGLRVNERNFKYWKEINEALEPVELWTTDQNKSNLEKRKQASEILFNTTYRKRKEEITSDMKECLSKLTDELSEEQQEIFSKLQTQLLIEHILIAVMVLLVLSLVLLASFQVFHPLKVFIQKVKNDEQLPEIGAYEMRFLAKNYNIASLANKQQKEELIYEASHDKLTGLYNRRGYELALENVNIDKSAVLMVDVDKFKTINDTYGHDIGDEILKRVASELFKTFGPYGYLCRIGGDEFVVIMTNTDESYKDRIRKGVIKINERLARKRGEVPTISISAGAAFGKEVRAIDAVLKEADKALYEAKDKGRGDICFFEQ